MSPRPVVAFALLAATTLGACTHRSAAQEQAAIHPIAGQESPDREAQRLAPVVDHHQHLLSPAGAALENRPAAPAVQVPAAIGRLLERRAELTGNPAELSRLYVSEGRLLGFAPPAWIVGPDDIAAYIAERFRPGYHITPVAFSIRGNVAEVAAYYSRGSGAELRHVGQLTMLLTRSPDREWRILSETPVFPGPTVEQPFSAAELIEMLDAAGIGSAVVFSDGYYFDGLIEHGDDPYEMMRAENDWTADQVSRFPDRLVAFCSFNPLAAYAIAELRRCAQRPAFAGLKLHFGTSGVDVDNPAHVIKIREVLAEANGMRWPIVVHLTASPAYGRRHAEIFVDQILPAAPDVPVVIAHLWGGAGYSDAALEVYAAAVASGNPAARNLYFDLAQVSLTSADESRELIAQRMRQIGFDRLFYGSDGPRMGGLPPRQMWNDFRVKMPLTDRELQQIADNVAPYLRQLVR